MGKRIENLRKKITQPYYELKEALSLAKECANAKFDESIEVAIKLGIDYKKQHVRGIAVLPHGLGKTRRILVFAEGAKANEAESAGADYVGSDEYIEKIMNGWLSFDCAIAIPSLMPKISKLGKILGPRGLMPNPKVGTVTQDVANAVKEMKKGRVEFKLDKSGCLHIPAGKASFPIDKLYENIVEILKSVWEAKPSSMSEEKYFKSVHISSTMGPGIKISPKSIREIIRSK